MSRRTRFLWAMLMPVLLVGCGASGAADAAAAGQPDYGTTKQMVIDILHSADGKQALAEVLQDKSLRAQFLVNQTDVSQAMEQALTSGKDKSLLAQQLQDPQFADALAKAIAPQLIEHQKQLMKDPSYQKDMLILLKSPEFTKQLQDLMQTPSFRGQIMQVMTDALKTPSFRMQFQDALKQAVAEQMQSAGGQSGQQKQGGGSSGSSGSEQGSEGS
ncbi:MAG: hypothetical protein K6T78_14425 [Alicyclobacillus sp.]|nr:hypothetical protein [Alicyclobacillus sp.]